MKSQLVGLVLAAALTACLAGPDSIFPEHIRQTAVNGIIDSYYAFDPFLESDGRQSRSGRHYNANPINFHDDFEPRYPSYPTPARLYATETYKPSYHLSSEKPYAAAYKPNAVAEEPPVYHLKAHKAAHKPYKPVYPEPEPYAPAIEPFPIDFEPYRPASILDEPDHHYKPGYEPSYQPNYEPEPYKPAYVEPKPYKPAYVEPKPYKPAYVEPKPYKPAYIEPKPYKPAYAEPEPYKPVYEEPKPYKPDYEPDFYKPTYEPKPYKPAYAEPEPYKPVYEESKPYKPAYKPAHAPAYKPKAYPESIYDKLDTTPFEQTKYPASMAELRNFPLELDTYAPP